MRPSFARPAFLLLIGSLGCGQVAPLEPAKREPPDPAPTATAPTRGGGPVPAPTPSGPRPPAGACGAVAADRTFPTADEQAVALHGLWIACASAAAPTLCPPSDSSMYFGALGAPARTSRTAACGQLSEHGSTFVVNPAHQFTYEVRILADDAGSAPRYEVRLSNATTDQRFALSYRDDTAATGFLTDGAITLVDAAGPGTLRHSSFTTF